MKKMLLTMLITMGVIFVSVNLTTDAGFAGNEDHPEPFSQNETI
ncbi:hypothetical protein QGM71_08460 [Virgibacillus sp. C22-A2]|uniref:Phr family secreted Rap phosphatase inhibitor n=1 Tax=Virgibacillus tibetensis TaxID=3042313 RepID=A0ABU6KE03_9BACI|nr:hypothetical protein [Virgibacillus sp. C22-A2]